MYEVTGYYNNGNSGLIFRGNDFKEAKDAMYAELLSGDKEYDYVDISSDDPEEQIELN